MKNGPIIWATHIQEMMEMAPVGSKWKHKKGTVYTVVSYTIIESTWSLGVVYENTDNHPLPITRASEEFFDGRFTRQGDQ